MKKTLLLLALCGFGLGGCAELRKGVCWVDTQIEGCPTVAETETDAETENGGN